MPMERWSGPEDVADAVAFPRVMEFVQRLAADHLGALLLSGSHATGEAVWADAGGRRLSLSDLDLYLVVDTEAARAAAIARGRAMREALEGLRREEGVAGPVEISYLTPARLERLPARPGTIELRLHGRAVAGDAGVRERIPDFGPRDVPREERLLLLENRAFELLLAHPSVAPEGEIAALQARHALHKAALDLALVAALERGELPDGAAARVAWVRRHPPTALRAWGGGEPAFGAVLEPVWDEALAWRERGARRPAPEAAALWHAVAQAWCALWLAVERGPGANARAPGDPLPAVASAARRAPLRRRLRLALRPEPRPARDPGVAHRVRHALAGTPQHRVNAAAALLLLSAVRDGADPSAPVLGPSAAPALRRLGVSACPSWSATAREVARAWDAWVLGGARLAEW